MHFAESSSQNYRATCQKMGVQQRGLRTAGLLLGENNNKLSKQKSQQYGSTFTYLNVFITSMYQLYDCIKDTIINSPTFSILVLSNVLYYGTYFACFLNQDPGTLQVYYMNICKSLMYITKIRDNQHRHFNISTFNMFPEELKFHAQIFILPSTCEVLKSPFKVLADPVLSHFKISLYFIFFCRGIKSFSSPSQSLWLGLNIKLTKTD